jgi:hypothetical protein
MNIFFIAQRRRSLSPEIRRQPIRPTLRTLSATHE